MKDEARVLSSVDPRVERGQAVPVRGTFMAAAASRRDVVTPCQAVQWYLRKGSRTGQRLGSNVPAGSANRQCNVPRRSTAISISASPAFLSAEWTRQAPGR